jgi:hypothetical protein
MPERHDERIVETAVQARSGRARGDAAEEARGAEAGEEDRRQGCSVVRRLRSLIERYRDGEGAGEKNCGPVSHRRPRFCERGKSATLQRRR